MFKKKENIVIIVLLLVMIVAIIGVSYAAFNYSKEGTTPNTITTGVISMTYTETDNVLNITGALPTTDKTGKSRTIEGEYFDFTVSSSITGNANINYEISAKKEDGNTIDGSNIKLYLTRLTDDGEEELMTPETYNEEKSSNTYTGRPAGEMSLYTSSMSASESNTYRLRMWVDEDYNPQGDGGNLTFSVRINVYGQDRVAEEVSTVLLNDIPKENQNDDGVDTFIMGEDPNNYIWYSGKLWRAISVNNEAKTTKLVTQWNISSIPYSSGSTDFAGSYAESWLNDTSVDGFLGNLRDYENFIVTDAKWDTTEDTTDLGSITRPNGTTIVEDAVGLLNMYEYQSSNNGSIDGYLNNGLYWCTLTISNSSDLRCVNASGTESSSNIVVANGVRPSINLKFNIKIVDGDGTETNPYRLEEDNDTNLSGVLLSSRYSGEYVQFGNNENNLYRLVSHEINNLTKITSAEPLKDSSTFRTIDFGDGTIYSSDNIIGSFLNEDYLNPASGYLTSEDIEMIEENTTWYLGTVGSGTSYKLAKYTDTNMSGYTTSANAKVGLLRLGELMTGQFERIENNTNYWTITPFSVGSIRSIHDYSSAFANGYANEIGIKPALNLKSNVVITGGDGTKNRPFTIELQ